MAIGPEKHLGPFAFARCITERSYDEPPNHRGGNYVASDQERRFFYSLETGPE